GLDGSDYINANFIKGYASKKTFIAAQAPMENTMNDFWRMIWEQDVRIIIMAANINERGRKQAYKYWPNDDEENLLVNADLEISCKKTEVFADYARREFELTFATLADREALARKVPEPESDYANLPLNRPASKNLSKLPDDDAVNKEVRKVVHYHFTNWVDLKAPESTSPELAEPALLLPLTL
uniref:Tyrosine-protein phosphatase domain-containing protein n=1 Tax=Panagrolaimus sp. JU765 TaxID=591449 RepID=A0AC34RHJ3_9BILA